MMHYVRLMTSHKTSSEGEQWIIHSFREDDMTALRVMIMSCESRNIPFEYQISDSAGTLKWNLNSEVEAEEEMANEADKYDPEGEWF